jgi:hypothetical protein
MGFKAGLNVGDNDGEIVGFRAGLNVGDNDGETGSTLPSGLSVGLSVGFRLGLNVGFKLGLLVVGFFVRNGDLAVGF